MGRILISGFFQFSAKSLTYDRDADLAEDIIRTNRVQTELTIQPVR